MIFAFVVRRLRWLAFVPLAPQLFDALLLTWTALFHRHRLAAMDAVEAWVLQLPGVGLCVHRFGGTGFVHAGREFAHLHGNGLLDLHLTREQADELIAAGMAEPHHLFGRSAWLSFWIRSAPDVPRAARLLALAMGGPRDKSCRKTGDEGQGRSHMHRHLCCLLALTLAGCVGRPALNTMDESCDVILRGGTIYDGRGGKPFPGDIAIRGDTIVAVGNTAGWKGQAEINCQGLAVAPGFINMLSWSTDTLLEDGRSQSEIRQGVTLEVMGEGESMGPWTEQMKKDIRALQADIKFPVRWTTLGEYLDYLEKRGVSCNVASFVGAATVRIHELGHADRPPTTAELGRMKQLVRQAMEEGAMGVASALIYAPGFYAKTDELIELAKVASEYDGAYISHLRSEGNRFLESLDELITIARAARIRAQVYHLKAAGTNNWPKMDLAIRKIEEARAAGLPITADMYTYTAGATGLDAAMPPWVQEGGYTEWAKRLRDPAVRERVLQEMRTPTDAWESLYLAAGSPENVLLVAFKNPALKEYTGKTLAEVAKIRGKSPEEVAVDLVVEDGSRVGTVYFMMSEENLRKQIALPWVSFDSDAGSMAPEGVFLKSNPHPRTYGCFARLLGKYVRDEKIIPLEEAVRRLTTLPASVLKVEGRGALNPGYFADVVVFDPAAIQDHATFEKPHQYATGVRHVLVNGVPVLKDGEHTGRKPGRVVRGPGWKAR